MIPSSSSSNFLIVRKILVASMNVRSAVLVATSGKSGRGVKGNTAGIRYVLLLFEFSEFCSLNDNRCFSR